MAPSHSSSNGLSRVQAERSVCCAAYMSSPCHIELVLSEKVSAVPAGVVSFLRFC